MARFQVDVFEGHQCRGTGAYQKSMYQAHWAEKTQVRRDNVNHSLGGGFKYFLFSPLFGEIIQFD